MRFVCNCCGAKFTTAKPQDPERDKGYGTCEECRPRVVFDMVRYGFADKDWTKATAEARLERYA